MVRLEKRNISSGEEFKMIIKLVEIYETTRTHSNETKRTYSLREVFINPQQVVCLREASHYKQLLQEGKLPGDLDSRQAFTHVHLYRGQTGLDLVVVGSPSVVEDKIKQGDLERKVLKG